MSDGSNRARPVHPGALLRRKLKQFDRSKAEIARLLGLSRQTLHEILAEKQSLTPSVALRVAKLTGTSPEMWLDLQRAHYLASARRDESGLLQNVPVLDER